MFTWPGLIFVGHHAIEGSLDPPSNVVCLPHRNGPLLPPVECQYIQHVKCRVEKLGCCSLFTNQLLFTVLQLPDTTCRMKKLLLNFLACHQCFYVHNLTVTVYVLHLGASM